MYQAFCDVTIQYMLEISKKCIGQEEGIGQEDMEYSYERTEQQAISKHEHGLELQLQPDIEIGLSIYNNMEYTP